MSSISQCCHSQIESNSRNYCLPPRDCVLDTTVIGGFSFAAILYGIAFTNPWFIAAGSLVCPAQAVLNIFTCQDRIFLRKRVERLETESGLAKNEIERLTAANRALSVAEGAQIVFQQTMGGLPASHCYLQPTGVGLDLSAAVALGEGDATFEELSAGERELIYRIDRLKVALTRMTRHRDLCVQTARRLQDEKSALVKSITKVIEQADRLHQFPQCREQAVRVVVDAKDECIQRLLDEIEGVERLIKR